MGLYAIIRIFVETAVENTIPITPEECKQACGISCVAVEWWNNQKCFICPDKAHMRMFGTKPNGVKDLAKPHMVYAQPIIA